MLRKNNRNNSYKSVIIDLGLAEYSSTEEYLFEKCGTPGYVAPEVFTKGAKSAKCDIFSLGVIFHML
jgi:serine/threonine protein kinase